MKNARASNRICEAYDELNNHFKLIEGTNIKLCEICGEKMTYVHALIAKMFVDLSASA